MKYRVTSKDPHKSIVMRAFREAYSATRVTDVVGLGDGVFEATVHRHIGNRKYERIGRFSLYVAQTTEGDSHGDS